MDKQSIAEDELLDALHEHFGNIPFYWQFYKSNVEMPPVDLRTVNTLQNIFVYAISPFAFGKQYSRDLFSKCAHFVGISVNGHINIPGHSLEAELVIMAVVQQVTHFMALIRQSSQAERYSSLVLKMTDPATVIQFGKEKFVELYGYDEWIEDEKYVLLFVIVFAAVNNEDLQCEINALVSKQWSEDSFDMLILSRAELCMRDNQKRSLQLHKQDMLLILSRAELCMRDNQKRSLQLHKQALNKNPMYDMVYSGLAKLYILMGQHQHAQWCAKRAIWLQPFVAETHITWLTATESLGDINGALQVSEALRVCYRMFPSYMDDVLQQQLIRINESLIEKASLDCGDGDSKRLATSASLISDKGAQPPRAQAQVISPANETAAVSEEDSVTIARSLQLMHRGMTGARSHAFNIFDALYEHYYFAPFDWLRCCPFSSVKGISREESFFYSTLFPFVISPVAYGVNFSNKFLAKCAKDIGLVGTLPFDDCSLSSVKEVEVKRLVSYTQDFLLLHRVRPFPAFIRDVLYGILKLRSTKEFLKSGRAIAWNFVGDIEWIDDDKVVFMFVVTLMFTILTEFRDAHVLEAKALRTPKMDVFHLSQTAKQCIEKRDYGEALDLYKRALKLTPMDPVLYSNVAQVYIYTSKYECARWSVLRAIWISPHIAKNHYRWIKATDLLGKVDDAYGVSAAVTFCIDFLSQIKECDKCDDLVNQFDALRAKVFSKESVPVPLGDTSTKSNKSASSKTSDVKSNALKEKQSSKQTIPHGKIAADVTSVRRDSSSSREKNKDVKISSTAPKTQVSTSSKNTAKKSVSQTNSSKVSASQVLKEPKGAVAPRTVVASPSLQKYLEEGSKFLINSVYKSSVDSYHCALEMLKNKGAKVSNFTDVDEVLLKYCYGKACIEKHTYEHLRTGVEMFEEILNHETISFPAAYYGKGRALFLGNRFLEAIEPLRKCVDVIDRNVHFEAHTYPGLPGEVIAETRRDTLKVLVEGLLSQCHSPPAADGTCIHASCGLAPKIYFTDPDFQGFTRLTCHDRCHIDFHAACWKEFMGVANMHGDKDALNRPCLTPDCASVVAKLELYGVNGTVRKTLLCPVEEKQNNKSKSQRKKQGHDKPKENCKPAIKKRSRVSSKNFDNEQENEEPARRSRSLSGSTNSSSTVPDTRNVVDAILVRKKVTSVRSHSPRPRAPPSPAAPLGVEIKFSDQDRVDELRARKFLAEFLASESHNDFTSVVLNPAAPFALPPPAIVRDTAAFEAYLRSNSGYVDAGIDRSTDSPADCRDLKEGSLSYMEQYVVENGPISVSSEAFLEEVNSFPIEVQELMCSFGDVKSFLANTALVFFGDVALSRVHLLRMEASRPLLRGLDLAVARSRTGAARAPLTVATSDPDFPRTRFRSVSLSRLAAVRSGADWDSVGDDGEPTTGGRTRSASKDDASDADDDSDVYDDDDDDDDENELEDDDEDSFDKEDDVYAVEQLQQQNRQLTGQLQSFRDKLVAVQRSAAAEREASRQKLDDLRERESVSLNTIKELEAGRDAQLKRVDAEKKKADRAVKNLTDLLAKRDREIDRIKQQLGEAGQALTEELRKLEEERRLRSEMKDDLDALRRNLAAMEQNHEGVVRENRDLKESVISLEVASTAEKAKVLEMTMMISEYKKTIEQLKEDDDGAVAIDTVNGSSDRYRLPLLPTPPPSHVYPSAGNARFAAKYSSRYQPIVNPLLPFAFRGYPLQFGSNYPDFHRFPVPPLGSQSGVGPISFGPNVPSVQRGSAPILVPTPESPPSADAGSKTVRSASVRDVSRFVNTAVEPTTVPPAETQATAATPVSDDCGSVGSSRSGEDRAKKKKPAASNAAAGGSLSLGAVGGVDVVAAGPLNVGVGDMAGVSLSYAAKASCRPKKHLLPAPAAAAAAKPPNASSFKEKIFNAILVDFPNLQMSEFCMFFQLVRATRKNALAGLKLKVIVARIRSEILKHRRSKLAPAAKEGAAAAAASSRGSAPSCWNNAKVVKAVPKLTASEECAICLIMITKEEERYTMSCDARHTFHRQCIKRWYVEGQKNCPFCRSEVPMFELEYPALKRK